MNKSIENIYSAITIVSNVTQGMKERGSEAILFTQWAKDFSIYVGFVSIAAMVHKNTDADPQFIANKWYDMYQKQDVFESTFPD